MLQSQVTGFFSDIHGPPAIERFFNTFLPLTPPHTPLTNPTLLPPPAKFHNFPVFLHQGPPSPSPEREREKEIFTISQHSSAIYVLAFLTDYHDFTGLLSSSCLEPCRLQCGRWRWQRVYAENLTCTHPNAMSTQYFGDALAHRESKVTCRERNPCIIGAQNSCNFPKEKYSSFLYLSSSSRTRRHLG